MKRLGILAGLLLALSVSIPAEAGHAWTALAPLPDPDGPGPATGRTEGHCTATIGDKIYVAYGFDPGVGDTRFLRIYDIASNTWSLGPLAPVPVRSEPYRGVAHGGKLYCLGKRPPGPNDVTSFDPASGTWTVLTSMSDPRAGTTAEVFGNGIYVFGGRKSSVPCGPAVTPGVFTTVQRYDIDTDSWSNAGNLAVNRSDATVARVGSNIYVFGGCDQSSASLSSIEVYDPVTQTATLLAATLPSGRPNAAAARLGNNIHVTGGQNSQLPPTTNHVIFDANTGTTSIGTPMPTNCPFTGAPRGEHELVSHGGRIYAVAGACPAFGTSLNNLDALKGSP